MKKFEVIMVECRNGKTTTLKQIAYCNSQQEIIDWYGLKEPDILSYEIKEMD